MRKHKVPTATSRVLEALVAADDFMTGRQLQAATALDCNHVSAALHSLRNHKAVQAMNVDGTLWWFATPEDDTRIRVLHERTPEARPRKPRKSKAVLARSIQLTRQLKEE
jgi:hypothetical protein